MEQILCIVGPTAVGKTRLSVALAQSCGAEIVSFDSMQVYRGMDIGTAKPSLAERGGVRHHMFDVAEPTESFSVSRYVELADLCVQDILRRGKPVILVGGTGLYIDSLVAGRDFAPLPSSGCREALERRVASEGIEPVYRELAVVDPEAAERIHPSNHKRVLRALEVYLETGVTISEHNRRTQSVPPKYAPVWIGLDYVNRETLYRRIDRRVGEMFEQGLVDEVRRLLESGVPSNATSLQAIGYKELVDHLGGHGTETEAIERICLASRRYAKRQRTWFRRNGAVSWLDLPDEADFAQVYSACRRIAPNFAR